MLKPRRWFRDVLLIGIGQAVVSAAIAALIGEGRSIDPSAAGSQPRLILSVLVLLSVVLPFVAYAADSRRVLLRHSRSAVAAWQVVGGLVGLSTTLAALLGVALFGGGRAAPGDEIWLIYVLVVPAFIIGALGATAGAILGLLGHTLFGWFVARRDASDRRPS